MKNIYPNLYYAKVEEITIQELIKNKIKLLILDVDNTLIDYYKKLSDSVINWSKEMKGQGIKLYILSNTNDEEKVKKVAQKLDIPYKHFAMKPLKRGFKKIEKETQIKGENIAVVGDQIFTDVLGGNRSGMFTILVEPIDNKKDYWYTAWKRPIENKITHIMYYAVFAILGLFVVMFVDWMNSRLPEYKKVFTKEIKEYFIKFKPNYILMLITSATYVALLYNYGIKNTFIANLDLIKFMILTPMLLSAFVIDYKLQIIPNRLNLTMFEVAFLYGLSDVAITINMVLGMLVGAGIFLAITLIGGLVYGKEAMGFGDVKLMGALGIYFGLSNIIVITLLSFLIGAILSIVLLATKIKKMDEYIPFGPFIVLGTFISIFVPFQVIKSILMQIFTLGLYKG